MLIDRETRFGDRKRPNVQRCGAGFRAHAYQSRAYRPRAPRTATSLKLHPPPQLRPLRPRPTPTELHSLTPLQSPDPRPPRPAPPGAFAAAAPAAAGLRAIAGADDHVDGVGGLMHAGEVAAVAGAGNAGSQCTGAEQRRARSMPIGSSFPAEERWREARTNPAARKNNPRCFQSTPKCVAANSRRLSAWNASRGGKPVMVIRLHAYHPAPETSATGKRHEHDPPGNGRPAPIDKLGAHLPGGVSDDYQIENKDASAEQARRHVDGGTAGGARWI